MTPASTVFLFLVFCGFSQVTFATALAVRLLPYFRHNLSGLFLHSNDWELFFMNCVEFVPFLISLYDVNFGLIAEYGGGRVEHQLVDGSIVCVQLFWLDYHNFFTYHLPFPLLGVYAFMDDPFCAGQILKRSTSLIEDSSYTLLNIKNNNSDTFCFSNKYTRNNYQAVGFYIEMLGTGECYPNGFTFLPLISYCAKLGCLSSGQMLHGQSVKLGVSSVLMSAPSFDGLDCEIPEFVFHVRGTSAKEIFWVTHGISQLTCADFFQTLGVKTPVMVRFSTAIHEYGSPETLRNSRGFAVKSYTRESHIQEKWRILFGDSGVPPDYRHMEGSGVDTYTLINKAWMVHFLKSHRKPTYGVKCLLEKGASKVNRGHDTHDIYDSIAEKNILNGSFFIQVIYPDLEDFDPLDVTMTWPEDDVPLQPVGLLVLNDNIDNFFAESEQLAFCPGPIDPKVHHYSDKPLRTRILSYAPPTSHSLQKLRGSHHLEYKVDLKAWGMIHLSIGGTTTSNSSTLQSNLSPTSPQASVCTIPKKHMRDEPQS